MVAFNMRSGSLKNDATESTGSNHSHSAIGRRSLLLFQLDVVEPRRAGYFLAFEAEAASEGDGRLVLEIGRAHV